jgi:ammonia channel protein AmtB
LGAIGCQLQIILFENYLFIDDPLNASGVHFGAGAVGMLFVAFMANPEYVGEDFKGIFYGGSFKFLGNQLYGMFVYTAWAGGLSGSMFFGLNQIGWFRVKEEEELAGMDISHHGGKAYPMDDVPANSEDTYKPGNSSASSSVEVPVVEDEA